jgi:hypothetical protein
VDLLSFVVIAVGGLILVADLGRPLRFIRAVMKPGTSWISRGAIADFIFLVTGGILVLPDLTIGAARPLAWLPWDATGSTVGGQVIEVVALLSAAVVLHGRCGRLHRRLRRSRRFPPVRALVAGHLDGGHHGDGNLGRGIGSVSSALLAVLAGLPSPSWHLEPTRPSGRAGPSSEAGSACRSGRGRRRRTAAVVLALIGLVAPPSRDAMGALFSVRSRGFWLRLATFVGFFRPCASVDWVAARVASIGGMSRIPAGFSGRPTLAIPMAG